MKHCPHLGESTVSQGNCNQLADHDIGGDTTYIPMYLWSKGQ